MTATVDGVLEHNKQIRDNMLKYNIGKYSQWPFALKPAIGEYYDMDYNRRLSDLKYGKDLLSFTHDGESTYSEEIKRKFFSSKEEEPYFVRPLTYGELNPWIEFQNGSYIQYIDDVFGKDDVMRHVDYVNNILSGQFIENALRQTEVGVIKDINVAVALQGIVTTNPNNMSGEDTVMGKISNRMYAQTLYNGAIFNSDRMKAKIHDGENYYQKAYLTPELVNQYGNNLANLYELSDIMKIGTNETHIREDLGADVHILDGYTENNFANLSLPQFRLLNEQIKNALNLRGVEYTLGKKGAPSSKIVGYADDSNKFDYIDTKGNDVLLPIRVYTPINGQGYVNAVKNNSDWRYDNLNFNKTDYRFTASQDVENPETSQEKGARLYHPYAIGVYNEGRSKYLNFEDDNNQFNSYNDISENGNDLLSKTSRLFNKGKLDTLIARFHTDETKYGKIEFTDTARSKFGNSHGRNLLRLNAANNKNNDTNGYDNPYCRTWTYHHQYNQVKKLIRPFTHVVDGAEQAYTNREIQSMNKKYRAYRSNGKDAIFGYQSLADNTVLQSNGFVKITPKSGDEGMDVRKCMFSIENLAWKDVLDVEDNLSKEQRGPNGGRIMWFPPYDLDFQEGVNVEWNQNTFIGRGEKVYTYTNTERTGTLSFSLLIDHPAIMNSVSKNSYEGMGEEKDPEADILRFFAGCELLPEPDNLTPPDVVPIKPPVTEPKEGKIVFKIYYPNNFTGIVSDSKDCKGNIIYDDFKNYVLSNDGTAYDGGLWRDYWWQYILVGNNTCVPADKQYFRGYEMLPISESGNGLTNNTEFTNIPLPTCKNNEYKVCPDIDKIQTIDGIRNTCTLGEFNKNEVYYYQVDEDLHQKLNDKGSYKDTTSFQLNASFETVDKKAKHQYYEYTFAEVMMALLLYNRGKGKYGSLYDKYKGYVINTLGVDNNRIKSLNNLFNNDKVIFTGVSYRGSADNNDKSNSSMLARRRAFTGFTMLKLLFGKLNDTTLKVTHGTPLTGGKNFPAYCEEQKIARFCEFTINYKIPAEELKDTIGGGGVANGKTTGITFTDYINAVLGYSPALKEYVTYTTGLGFNMPMDNGRLKKDFESHFNGLPDKDSINLTDETFLKGEVDELLKFINRDALILAFAVSNDKTEADFRDKYDVPCNQMIEPPYDNLGYTCLRSSTGCTETGCPPLLTPDEFYQDEAYLRYILACFIGSGAKESDYEPVGEGDTYFEFTVPSCLDIYKSNGGTSEYETYSISMDKVLVEVILGHYLRDNYDKFNICSKKDKRAYMVRLCELIYADDCVLDIIKGTGDEPEGMIPKRDKINYQNAYLKLLDGIIIDKGDDEDEGIIPCPLSLLNEEIRDEEEKEKQEEQGQQIQEQRPETEENKAEQQEEKKSEVAMVYGMDKDIPNIRYESEGDYFKNIEITDPLLFRSLKDKFKYFNPAYHSISPEGFNARLTFLQQCTRQGQTYEIGGGNKPGNRGTASNLAFGRMPVCVIRIGDFINTRAIINSMSISYAAANGLVWDLNSEGAGVQPMYAKVSLAITLLGGQSLGAPISRLQNAISFNYYANTEAYDNRADVATYEKKEGGEGYTVEYKRLWTPINDKNYIPKNDKAILASDDKKEKTQNAQDGSFKQPTDEQIADKLNHETSGETAKDEIVSSQMISSYVSDKPGVNNILTEYFAPIEGFDKPFVIVKCNKRYEDTNYMRSEYKGDSICYTIAGELPIVYSDEVKSEIYLALDDEIMSAIIEFRDTNNG